MNSIKKTTTLKKVLQGIGIIIIVLVLFSGGYLIKIKSEQNKMSPMKTTEIVNGIFSVQDSFANLYLIKDGDQYIAIDAGNNLNIDSSVSDELKKLNISPNNITTVLLTHTDADHVAALKLFKNAKIYLSKQEEQMINGEKSRLLFFGNNIGTKEYSLVEDQQILTFGNIKIKGILNPGHTPGSMSYLVNEKYLFTGDALSIKAGKIDKFNEFFNMDTKTAIKSIERITKIPEAEYIFTSHYGYTDDYKNAVKDWLYMERQTIEPPVIPSSTVEPALRNLSILNHVSDDKLGYGFEYPEGWGAFVNVDKDVEQCDPARNYENYNCVDFPDKNIKKVISIKKEIYKEGAQVSVDIEFMVKSVTDLQDVANEFKKEVAASGMPILNETTVSINNISGYNILAGTPDWKLRQVVFFANGTAYIFKYSSQEEFYRLNEDTFNNIINSFNIKNEKQNETNANKPTTDKPAKAQIANPASVNCIEKGGKLSIVDKPEGQVGMCTFSDGTVCEEWAYFRGECPKK